LNLFILDCSVTMSWCLENEKNKDSEQALYLLAKKKAIVPCIWTLEVINVLRVAERQNRISSADSNTFISLLNTFPIEVDVNSDSLNRKNFGHHKRTCTISLRCGLFRVSNKV
jgi:predicted nucleic acid-binding protein